MRSINDMDPGLGARVDEQLRNAFTEAELERRWRSAA
jgi:hypothetical protein